MKKFFGLIMVFSFFMVFLGCEAADDKNTIEGPVSVVLENSCFDDMDCDFRSLCVLDKGICSYKGECEVNFETFVEDDGTSKTIKVYDSCQRFGDLDYYCDPHTEKCVKVENEQPPVEEPVTYYSVRCCFDTTNLTADMYGQFHWSESSNANPEASNGANDRTIDASGCIQTTKDARRDKVYQELFWVELTKGKVQDYTDTNNNGIRDAGEPLIFGVWLNTAFTPTACWIDDKPVSVGPFMQSCGFGIGKAFGLSCL